MPKMHVDLKNIVNQLTTSIPAKEKQMLIDLDRAFLSKPITINGEEIQEKDFIKGIPEDYRDYIKTYFHQGGHIGFDTIRTFLMLPSTQETVYASQTSKENELKLETFDDELHIKGTTKDTKIDILYALDDEMNTSINMDIDYHVKLYKRDNGEIGYKWEKVEFKSDSIPKNMKDVFEDGDKLYQEVIKKRFKQSLQNYVQELPSDWELGEDDRSSVNEVDSKLDRLMELDPQTRFDITQQLIKIRKDEVPISNKLIAELLENYPVLEPLYAEKTNNLPHDLQVDNKLQVDNTLDNGNKKIAMAVVAAIALSAALLTFGFISGGIIPIIIGSIIGGMASLTTTFPNRSNHSNSKEEIIEPRENTEAKKGRLLERLEKIKGHKPTTSFSTETPLTADNDQPNTPENSDGNNDRKPRGTSI